MTPSAVIIAVLFAAFAVSYGWGMRGCIIGGEKGALVPGALLGLSLSLFCCNGLLKEFYPFFCAVGALGMSFGGIEPYAQTMGFILHRDQREEYKGHVFKGAAGIFLKGALWFGIAGAFLGLLPAALSGRYSAAEIAVLFIAVPFVSLAGTLIFNKPYDRESKRFPKLYFSLSSREEWGGNLSVLFLTVLFAAVKRNFFALGAACFGLLFGGIGFLSGLLIYDFVVREHNGKLVFGKYNRCWIDGWKIMEHSFGAIGGAGVMLWFCLNADGLASSFAAVNLSSLAFGGDKNAVGMAAVVLLLFVTAVQYPVKAAIAKKGKEPDEHIFELFERPCWAAFPLIFIFLGSEKAAFASAFLTVTYALCEKCGIEWFDRYEHNRAVKITMAVFLACSVILFFVKPELPVAVLAAVYTFAYTLSVVWYFLMPDRLRKIRKEGIPFAKANGTPITVTGHFLLQSAVILIVTVIK